MINQKFSFTKNLLKATFFESRKYVYQKKFISNFPRINSSNFSRKMTQDLNLKPLNVLIYFQLNKDIYDEKTYQRIREFCLSHLNNLFYQTYTVYETNLEEINEKAYMKTIKYFFFVHDQENSTELLNSMQFLNYLNRERILNFIEIKKAQNEEYEDFIKKRFYSITGIKETVDRIIPDIKKHYVYLSKEDNLEKVKNYFETEKIDYQICNNLDEIEANFNAKNFFDYLRINNFEKNIIVSDVTTSTQPILENLNYIKDLVVISEQQLNGKGRSKNKWISPKGSLSFSFSNSISNETELYKNLSFYQHLTSLAVIYAIESFVGSNKLNIKIKWPNDIYFDSIYKMCGILVKSELKDNLVVFNVGIGINYKNKEPTFSLISLMKKNLSFVEDMSKEALVANILIKLEKLIKIFNNGGKNDIIKSYHEKWMLSDKKIKLKNNDFAIIKGIDSNGYLEVEYKSKIVSLMPDSNRFDILENLTVNENTEI